MAVRMGLVLLLLALALALVAESSLSHNYDTNFGVTARMSDDSDDSNSQYGLRTCNGLVGDCIAEEEEMLMDSESNRRMLYQSRYISYWAMRRNRTPCGQRGRSYYNCRRHRNMNPYRRGCSKITRCRRFY